MDFDFGFFDLIGSALMGWGFSRDEIRKQALKRLQNSKKLRPLFELVTPNKTTLEELDAALQKRGLDSTRKVLPTGFLLALDSGSIDLVGKPAVQFESSSIAIPIERIRLFFNDGYKASTFRSYQMALIKALGKPDVKGLEHGNRFAGWNFKDHQFVAALLGSPDTDNLIVNFAMGGHASQLWAKVKEAKEKQS